MFNLSQKSKDKLTGVHPDLVKVIERAIQITDVDFVVLEGVRDKKRQKELVENGASLTMNSRHIPGKDGFSKAVDLGALNDGQISWLWPFYEKIAKAVKEAAREMNIPVEWGGDWKKFKDGLHFQLPNKEYP